MSYPAQLLAAMGFLGLQVVLIWLRLAPGGTSWPWWAVSAPCLLLLALMVVIVFIVGLVNVEEP